MSIKDDKKILDDHIQFALETVIKYNKKNISKSIFKNIKKLLKIDNKFMEYKTTEKTVKRNPLNDREFPLSNTVINNIPNINRIDEATIHIGMSADEFTRSFHALALTIGSDIYFRNGSYKPETEEGQVLLAHELTHVSQNEDNQFVNNSTKEDLEKEAEINENTVKYNPDPIIQKEINGQKLSLKKSEWIEIKKLALKELEDKIEEMNNLHDDENFYKLLLEYQKFLDEEASTWLI